MSRTKPNHRRVWGTRPLRTVGDRRKARPHGADARDYAAVFRVFKVPVGRILLSHVFGPFQGLPPAEMPDRRRRRSHWRRAKIAGRHSFPDPASFAATGAALAVQTKTYRTY